MQNRDEIIRKKYRTYDSGRISGSLKQIVRICHLWGAAPFTQSFNQSFAYKSLKKSYGDG